MAKSNKPGNIVNLLRAGMDPIPGLIPRHAQLELEDLQVLGFEIPHAAAKTDDFTGPSA
jgi:hypothetical protein